MSTKGIGNHGDAEATGDGSVIALLKRIRTLLAAGGAGGGSSGPVSLAAGENFVGRVGGTTALSTAVPTTSASPAYAANDCVGGLLVFPGATRLAGGGGLVHMAAVQCKSAQTAPLDLVLFAANPAGSAFADNAPLALAAADFDKVAGVAHVTDWSALGGGSGPSLGQAFGLSMPFRLPAGTDLWGVLVARAALTLASTTDVKVVLKLLQD